MFVPLWRRWLGSAVERLCNDCWISCRVLKRGDMLTSLDRSWSLRQGAALCRWTAENRIISLVSYNFLMLLAMQQTFMQIYSIPGSRARASTLVIFIDENCGHNLEVMVILHLIIPKMCWKTVQKTLQYLCVTHVDVAALCVSSMWLTVPGIMRTSMTVWEASQILVLPSFSCQPTQQSFHRPEDSSQ